MPLQGMAFPGSLVATSTPLAFGEVYLALKTAHRAQEIRCDGGGGEFTRSTSSLS